MQPRIPEKESWNFRELPPEQALAACYYEFARESPSLLEFYSQAPVIAGPSAIKSLHSRETCQLVEAVQEQAYPLHFVLKFFQLGNSWQTLDKDVRVIVSQELERLRQARSTGCPSLAVNRCQAVPWVELTVEEMPFRPLGLDPKLGIERTLIEIDWRSFTNEQIREAFRKWVKDARPPTVLEPLERGHKPKDHLAKLHRLGIRRVRSRLAFSEAAELLAKCGSELKFKDASESNREANRVDADLHELFPFLPEAEVVLSGPIVK